MREIIGSSRDQHTGTQTVSIQLTMHSKNYDKRAKSKSLRRENLVPVMFREDMQSLSTEDGRLKPSVHAFVNNRYSNKFPSLNFTCAIYSVPHVDTIGFANLLNMYIPEYVVSADVLTFRSSGTFS